MLTSSIGVHAQLAQTILKQLREKAKKISFIALKFAEKKARNLVIG